MSGYIYFITMEPDYYVKIGWALHNPYARMQTLQTGCPEALRMMAACPGSRDEEKRLHETFAELHYRGEWFFNQYKLQDFIEFLSNDYPRETKAIADRQRFEDAIWDVVITGFTHPEMSEEHLNNYLNSGDGRLWHYMHPEMLDA